MFKYISKSIYSNKKIARIIIYSLLISVTLFSYFAIKEYNKIDKNSELLKNYFIEENDINRLTKEYNRTLENKEKDMYKYVFKDWNNIATWFENLRTTAVKNNLSFDYTLSQPIASSLPNIKKITATIIISNDIVSKNNYSELIGFTHYIIEDKSYQFMMNELSFSVEENKKLNSCKLSYDLWLKL